MVTGKKTAVEIIKTVKGDTPTLSWIKTLNVGRGPIDYLPEGAVDFEEFTPELQSLSSPVPPQGYYFPEGIYSFRIEGLTPGSCVYLRFYLSKPFQEGDKW